MVCFIIFTVLDQGYSECSEGEVSCQDDEGSCVAASSLCDSKVDCKNARDELGCSCTQRIPKVKHCDGIEDCPDSSDENYCHGLSNHSLINIKIKNVNNSCCVKLYK